ncbi:MAG TPA: type II secretion system protein N, partial [Chloroflexota bacterium]|nr:type II secretion system protein N [Chloroflexota bacterium]
MAVGNHPAGHFSGAPATKRVRGLLAGRRRIAMPALVAALLLFGTAMLPAHASVTRSQIPAASLKLTLKGTVLSGTNQPVAGAIVEAAGKSAWTNAAGRYALVVPLKLTTTGMAWGPGFSVQSFTFTLSFLPKVSTTITVSPFHLDSLFSDPRYGAVLKGLSPVMDGSPATVKVHGRSGIPLDGRLYLEWPNGSVHTSP